MCFNAGISFATGAVLAATGVEIVRRKPMKHERLFAAIPFLFAIQQVLEGTQWLFVKFAEGACLPLGYGYLFFAYLFWPVYIPLSVFCLEKNNKRRRALLVLVGMGIMMSFFLLLVLISRELHIVQAQASLQYVLDVAYGNVGIFVYGFIVCASFFVSGQRFVRMFGGLMLASFVVSILLFQFAFTSVWCFFAALLSFVILFHFKHRSHKSD